MNRAPMRTGSAAHMVWLAKQLRGEADRWPAGPVREALVRASTQLVYWHRSSRSNDVEQQAHGLALADGAATYLARVMATRSGYGPEEGAAG